MSDPTYTPGPHADVRWFLLLMAVGVAAAPLGDIRRAARMIEGQS